MGLYKQGLPAKRISTSGAEAVVVQVFQHITLQASKQLSRLAFGKLMLHMAHCMTYHFGTALMCSPDLLGFGSA